MLGWDGPLTHRQHLTWLEWDREQLNHPSRSDHYLMQIAGEVAAVPARAWGIQSPQLPLDTWKIKFGSQPQGGPASSQESKPVQPLKGVPRPVTKDDLPRMREKLARASMEARGKVAQAAQPPQAREGIPTGPTRRKRGRR